MGKVYESLFMMITLIAGVSIGLFAGVKYNPNATVKMQVVEKESGELKNVDKEYARSVQDIVISNVQKENEARKDYDEIIEVVASKTKISPYAKMVIKKKYTRCGHQKLEIVDVPEEIINFTEEELKEKYDGWEIESFDEEQLVLSREIKANCEDHYVIKEESGEVFVYHELTAGINNLIEEVDVNLNLLMREDREALEMGIEIYGEEELEKWKENYTS